MSIVRFLLLTSAASAVLVAGAAGTGYASPTGSGAPGDSTTATSPTSPTSPDSPATSGPSTTATPTTTPGGPGHATLSIVPAVVVAGHPVRITGSVPVTDCPAPDAATLVSTSRFFPPDGFGPKVARNASGAFATTYRVPANTPPGSYAVRFRCGGGVVNATASVRVTTPQVATVPSGGVATGAGGTAGSDHEWLALGIGAGVGLGLCVLAVSLTPVRRRLVGQR